MNVPFVVLLFVVAIAALWFIPVHLWLREDVKFWRKQSEGWKAIAEEGNALIERNHRAAVDNLELADRILNGWKKFRYAVLRDGVQVGEFTEPELALRSVMALVDRDEEENGGVASHRWAVEDIVVAGQIRDAVQQQLDGATRG